MIFCQTPNPPNMKKSLGVFFDFFSFPAKTSPWAKYTNIGINLKKFPGGKGVSEAPNTPQMSKNHVVVFLTFLSPKNLLWANIYQFWH